MIFQRRHVVRALAILPVAAFRLHSQDPHAGHSMPPDTTPKGWDFMVHGAVWAQYDKQGGPRGDEQVGLLNWGMFIASRAVGGGRFQARTMLSVEPWTVSSRGYPLLLQTGESYRGAPLIDRQHPHDFWMELAAQYERPLTRSVGLLLYGGPSGEPALGPVAFMHRPSAMDMPFAPLGHHWQDATHISFGVVRAGLFTNRFKIEGSVFNGREPDEHRWNFDPIKLDSYSGRLTFNPTASWSMSAGYGWLKSPEILNPDESTHRITASVLYATKLGAEGQLASAVIWGANAHDGDFTHSMLAESEGILDRSNTVLGRAEFVQKGAADLGLSSPDRFNVAAVSAGYIREIVRARGATIGLGAMGTVNVIPSSLETTYGSKNPVGGTVFLRLRPAIKNADSMPGMSHD